MDTALAVLFAGDLEPAPAHRHLGLNARPKRSPRGKSRVVSGPARSQRPYVEERIMAERNAKRGRYTKVSVMGR